MDLLSIPAAMIATAVSALSHRRFALAAY